MKEELDTTIRAGASVIRPRHINSNGSQNEEPEPEEWLSLPRLMHFARTYLWAIIGIVALTLGLTAFWTSRQPKIYEATVTLEYDPNPPRPLGRQIEDVADPLSNYWSSRQFFETQNKILSSRYVAERTVEALGLNKESTFLTPGGSENFKEIEVALAAEVLRGRLRVQPVNDTHLVRVTVADHDPERAALIGNTLANEFIKKSQKKRIELTQNAAAWLEQHLVDQRKKLLAADEAMHQFRKEQNVLSLSLESKQSIVASNLQQINTNLNEASAMRRAVEARAARVRKGANLESPMESDPGIFVDTELRGRVRAVAAEKRKLDARYGAQHNKSIEKSAELAELNSQLEKEIRGILFKSEQDLNEIKRKEAGLRADLKRARSSGLKLGKPSVDYGELARDQQAKLRAYTRILDRKTDTDLTSTMELSHVSILDRALTPRGHVKPRLLINLLLAFVVGLFLSGLFVTLLHKMDRRLLSAEHVESLGLPVLGIMPAVSETSLKNSEYKMSSVAAPNADEAPDELIVYRYPMSTAAECCRMIRTNLMFISSNSPLQAMVVTSPGPREGKTTVAANLAASIAKSGRRVLLIDTDLRRPRVHRLFELKGIKRGVTSILAGVTTLEDAVVPSIVENLDLLPCGPIPPNPSELLHGTRFAKLIDQARETYDLILLDSPPVGAVTDATILASQLDGVMLVVRAGNTTRDGLKGALRQLRDVRANLVGSVINSVELTSSRYGGYYRYYRPEGYYTSEAEAEAEASADV